jgi:hypothetical protein
MIAAGAVVVNPRCPRHRFEARAIRTNSAIGFKTIPRDLFVSASLVGDENEFNKRARKKSKKGIVLFL